MLMKRGIEWKQKQSRDDQHNTSKSDSVRTLYVEYFRYLYIRSFARPEFALHLQESTYVNRENIYRDELLHSSSMLLIWSM